jgi:hypothetical protein
MRSSMLQAFGLVLGLAGCSSSAFPERGHPGRERLEVLTGFTLALSKYDFREAASYLAPADRAKLAGADAGILPEYRERIRAIRRTTLLNNPLIEVRRGLIYGIPEILPVLEVGDADSAIATALSDTSVAPMPAPGLAPRSREKEELKRAAEAFFRAVSRRDWNKALAYVDAQEREGFLDAAGKIKIAARQRLAAADTADWEALTLKDGKLTGVVLIIPAGADKPPAQ